MKRAAAEISEIVAFVAHACDLITATKPLTKTFIGRQQTAAVQKMKIIVPPSREIKEKCIERARIPGKL